MAFRDIENWARIIESQEESEASSDIVRELNNRRTLLEEKRELENCGEKEIDPETLGIRGECDECDECEGDVSEEDPLDEYIDFSEYQLDEADLREPITAASAALDRPASTADLVGQDAVRLMAEAEQKATSTGQQYQGGDNIPKLIEDLIGMVKDFSNDQLKQFKVVGGSGGNGRYVLMPSQIEDGTLTVVAMEGRNFTRMYAFLQYLQRAGVKKLSEIRNFKFVKADDNERKVVDFGEFDFATLRPDYLYIEIKTQQEKNKFADMFENDLPMSDLADDLPGPEDAEPEDAPESGSGEPAPKKKVATGKKKAAKGKKKAKAGKKKSGGKKKSKTPVNESARAAMIRRTRMLNEALLAVDESEEVPQPDSIQDKIDDMKEEYKDYPISDAEWERLDKLTLAEQIQFLQDKIDSGGLTDQQKQYLRDDIQFLQAKAEKESENDRNMARACWLQDRSFERDLTEAELKEFVDIVQNRLDDYFRAILADRPRANGYVRGKRVRLFLPPTWIKGATGAPKKNDPDPRDVTDDELLDQELAAIDVDMARRGHVFQPNTDPNQFEFQDIGEEPGYYEYEFDPEHQSHHQQLVDLQKMVDDLSKITEPYFEQHLKQDYTGPARSANAERVAQKYFRGDGPDAQRIETADDMEPAEFIQMLNGIPKSERDDLKNILIAGAEDQDEKDFIETVWGGIPTIKKKLNKQKANALFGMGSNQKGRTGGGTEQQDRWINMLLVVACATLNICTDEINEMHDVVRSETPENREARRRLRPIMAKEIAAELGLDPNIVPQETMRVNTKKDRNGNVIQPLIRGEKALFNKIVVTLVCRVIEESNAEEKEGMRQILRDFINDTKVVKWKSGLTGSVTTFGQNDEFQALVAKARKERAGNGNPMTDADWLRLRQLNYMRKGDNEQRALEKATQDTQNPNTARAQRNETDLVNTFLKGGSANYHEVNLRHFTGRQDGAQAQQEPAR